MVDIHVFARFYFIDIKSVIKLIDWKMYFTQQKGRQRRTKEKKMDETKSLDTSTPIYFLVARFWSHLFGFR